MWSDNVISENIIFCVLWALNYTVALMHNPMALVCTMGSVGTRKLLLQT